jgi:hypothetical protein
VVDVALEIRPSRWRHSVMLGCAMLLPQLLLPLLFRGQVDLPRLFGGAIGVAIGVVIAVVFFGRRMTRRGSIKLRNGRISGPSRWGFGRVQFAVSELDHERSARPGLFGGRTLWSRSGKALNVSAYFVPRHQRAELDRALGLDRAVGLAN